MAPILFIHSGKNEGKEFQIQEGSNLVGRWDPDTGSFPEIDLDDEDVDAKISRKHAIVRKEGDSLTIRDIGSLNGTFLNRGERLEEGKDYPLKDGDEIVIGKLYLRLKL